MVRRKEKEMWNLNDFDGDLMFLVPGEKTTLPLSKEFKYGNSTKYCVFERNGILLPLKHKYVPKNGDIVVGVLKNDLFWGAIFDIASPYGAIYKKEEGEGELETGAVYLLEISKVDELHEAEVRILRKLYGGDLIKIDPARVARVIGKKSSMILLLKGHAGERGNIYVGKNGLVYVISKDKKRRDFLCNLIRFIERNAHKEHLTVEVEKRLEEFEKNSEVFK